MTRVWLYACPICNMWSKCRDSLDRHVQQAQGYCTTCKQDTMRWKFYRVQVKAKVRRTRALGMAAPDRHKPRLRTIYTYWHNQYSLAQQMAGG